MTDRSDIKANSRGWRRLSYTCRCGWVDWGHALPGAAQKLKQQIEKEKADWPWPKLDKMKITLDHEPAYVVYFGLSMGKFGITVSTGQHWIVKRGLSKTQRESVALSIYLNASHKFERLQGSFPFGLISSSDYSPEDLVSNLIGFYSAFKGIPQEKMRKLCGDVGEKESFVIWDNHLPDGLSGFKNKTTRPILFPTKKCVGNTSFPTDLNTIQPIPAGKLWTSLKRYRYIPASAAYANIPLNITPGGEIEVPQPVKN